MKAATQATTHISSSSLPRGRAAQAGLGGAADLYAAAFGQARVPVYGNSLPPLQTFTLIAIECEDNQPFRK